MFYSICINFINDNISNDTQIILPLLDVSSSITNIPHLTNSDVDLHMPYDKNFNYYTAHDFHSNQNIIECYNGKNAFSVLNCNIRSISANFNNLVNMLFELHHPLIGLSETKIKSGQDPVINCELPGYRFVSQPSHSRFLIRNEIKCIQHTGLSVVKNEFETLWPLRCKKMTRVIYCVVSCIDIQGGVNVSGLHE